MRRTTWNAMVVVLSGVAGCLSWGAEVSKDVKIVLETERHEYLVGEPVIVKMGVRNVTDHVVTISVGGDYRGGTRAHRFVVTAKDETGKVAIDPDPVQIMMGGLGGDRQIKPGATEWLPLNPLRYRLIDRAGTYTFTIGHDLGLGESKSGPPGGAGDVAAVPHAQITLKFRMPTEQEAAELVEKLVAMKDNGLTMVSDKRPEPDVARDFGCLRLPVYLPALKKHIADGGRDIVQGIGSVETPEGTEALIEVLSEGNEEAVREALWQLRRRVPGWAMESYWGKGDKTGRTEAIVKATWREEFAPKLRAWAMETLEKFEAGKASPFVGEVCEIEMHVGTEAELPAIGRALEAAVERNKEQANYPYYLAPEGADSLVRAATALVQRGAKVGEASGLLGRLVEMQRVVSDKGYRPAGWERVLTGLAGDEKPALRGMGLNAWNAVPEGLPAEVVAMLPRRLEDGDRMVRYAALLCAGKSQEAGLAAPILEMVKKSEDEGEVKNAGSALEQLKQRGAWLAICADRLDEEGRWQCFFQPLGECLDGLEGGRSIGKPESAEAQRQAADAWQAFVGKHRAELDAGKKVPYTEADPAMSPRPNSFTKKGGGEWPERK